jgi:hypothetical protein
VLNTSVRMFCSLFLFMFIMKLDLGREIEIRQAADDAGSIGGGGGGRLVAECSPYPLTGV